jgi:CHAT domain-containing protein
LSQVRPGDELMGLAAAVLGRGTSSIVASVVPVPDDGTASLMSGLHARLLAGESPAPALAAAAAATEVEGFVCLGAG